MTKKLVPRLTIAFLYVGVLANSLKADAQAPVSGKQAAGIFAVLIGGGAGIGVGVYLLVRAPRNITGCVSEVQGNLQLTEDKAMSHYLLEGDTSAIKPSERVRLSGKPGKSANKRRTFFVKKVSKDYGLCKVSSAMP